MKRIIPSLLILCLLLMCLPAALADGAVIEAAGMPGEVKEYFSAASFNGYTIGAGATVKIENTVAGSYYFAVTANAGHNVLHLFKLKDGLYQHVLRTDSAVPQGRGSFFLSHQVGSLYLLSDKTLTLGDAVSIMFTLENYEEQGYASVLFEVNKNGVWNLRLACVDYLWTEVLVKSDSLTYYHEGVKQGIASGVAQTDLRYFSFSAFPKTLSEAKEKLSNPPEIPYSAQLQAKRVKFTGGQKYAVYTGPGEKFFRAANGKAAVSTNDWIQVFGVEDGWAMIQYDLSSDQCRIGWIDAAALPKNANVSALRFNDEPAIIAADTDLTDDPLMSRSYLRTLRKGQQVTWLATLGQWAYVQDDQNWVRGFVPLTAIAQDTEKTFTSQPVSGPDYLAQGTAVVAADKTAQINVVVSASGEWLLSCPILRYQVYANNVLVGTAERENAVFNAVPYTAKIALPQNASVIGLCPVYADGVRTDEAVTIFVGP